jgi:predicted nicotinamide N-methyase
LPVKDRIPNNPTPDPHLQTILAIPSDSLIARHAPLLPAPGRPDLLAHQAADVYALWLAWEGESGEKQDIPYWAVLWPAARMVAEWIGADPAPILGKNVLDFGCGCGIAGLAALHGGAARVMANDIDPVALEFARRNARANGLSLALDDRNLLDIPPDPAWDVILAADLFYEKTVADAMLAWLLRARGNGTAVYIADANRPFSPRSGVATLLERRYPTNVDLEGTAERTVRLLALRP